MVSTSRLLKPLVVATTVFAAITSASEAQTHGLIRGASPHLRLLTAQTDTSTATNDLPSLKLSVRIKRAAVQMHDTSSFDVLASPVVTVATDGSKSVYYNGVASFDQAGTSYTYKLVDGVAYVVTTSSISGYATESVTCLTSTSLPPVKDILEALNTLSPVGGVVSSEAITCPSGKLFQTTLVGEPYVVCASPPASVSASASASSPSPSPTASSTSSGGFSIYGANFDVDVSYLSAPVAVVKPSISDSHAAACAKTPLTATLTAATASLLSNVTTNSTMTRRLESEATVILPEATCACKGTKRPCLFVHGLGQATDQGLVESFDYFGKDLASHAPCCSSIKYAVLDTTNNAWYSDSLQQRLCDLSYQVSSTSSASTKTIADTIIVTHSMGNLMLGGAIATGKCSLASSTTWVGLSGPMKGSMGSDFLQNTCAGQTNGLVELIANIIGRCPANPSTVSLAYEGEKYASATLNAKYTAAAAAYTSNVDAVMCSNDYSGLLSIYQLPLKLAGSIIPHKSPENDGIVEYQSCSAGIPTSKFANIYTSQFYVTKLNHLDTTFRNGDALIQTSQMPVKWFECLL